MKGVEGIKVKGFYRIRLVDKEGKVISYENHNFVTNNIKKIALEQSMNRMFKMNLGNPFGSLLCIDNTEYANYAGNGSFLAFNGLKGSDAVVLLNLPDSLTMDPTSKFLNVIASDGSGIDSTKITGFAVGRQSSGNAKEGVLQDITSADMMADQYQIVNTFMFDIDKANGSFNWIAVMPGFEYTPFRGLMGFKCISNYNVRSTQNAFVKGYVAPGVQDTKGNVLTGPNQILTFENNGSNSKWYYDIVTGEKRAVQPDEFAYNWTCPNVIGQNVGHMVAIGDFLYVIGGAAGTILYKINIETGAVAGQTTIANDAYFPTNQIGMFYNGTNIIVSCATKSTTESRAYISTVNINTMTASKVNNNVYTGWGGLPTGWIPRNCMYTKVGDNYFVQNLVATPYQDMVYNGCVIICSDITNVMGSIIGIMPPEGFNAYVVNETVWCINQFTDNPAISLKLTEGASTGTNYTYDGIYISNLEYGNYWSASKLDQTYTKTNEIKAIIDYGYSFE